MIFLRFLILMRLLFLSVHQSFSILVYLPPHERFITLPISVTATVPKSPRSTGATFQPKFYRRLTLEKILMSQERKGTSKLWSTILFSRDLTHVWWKSRERLPFSSGGDMLPQNPALPAQKAGSGEAYFTSSNQVFNAEVLRQFRIFQATKLLHKSGWENPTNTHKWLRGPITKFCNGSTWREKVSMRSGRHHLSRKGVRWDFNTPQFSVLTKVFSSTIKISETRCQPCGTLITMWGGEEAALAWRWLKISLILFNLGSTM